MMMKKIRNIIRSSISVYFKRSNRSERPKKGDLIYRKVGNMHEFAIIEHVTTNEVKHDSLIFIQDVMIFDDEFNLKEKKDKRILRPNEKFYIMSNKYGYPIE